MNVRDGFFMLEGMRIALKEMMNGLDVPESVLTETASNIFGKWAEEHSIGEMRGTEEDMENAYFDLLIATAE